MNNKVVRYPQKKTTEVFLVVIQPVRALINSLVVTPVQTGVYKIRLTGRVFPLYLLSYIQFIGTQHSLTAYSRCTPCSYFLRHSSRKYVARSCRTGPVRLLPTGAVHSLALLHRIRLQKPSMSLAAVSQTASPPCGSHE